VAVLVFTMADLGVHDGRSSRSRSTDLGVHDGRNTQSDTDVRIERHIPNYLVDEVDNRLKMDGWRLHRPSHHTTGELRSPNRTRRPNSDAPVMTPHIPFFDVVPDVPCDIHDWYPSDWRPLGTVRFCLFCGERGSW